MPGSADKAAHKRLGMLLTRRRVELDPRYRNRAVFAREKGINYRLVMDIENAARPWKKAEDSTKALFELAYLWREGSWDAVLAGGNPAPVEDNPEADTRPEIVRQLWHHEHVRTLWGLSLPEDHRLELVESYAATLNPGTPGRRQRA